MRKDTSWGKVADWYHSYLNDPDNYHSQVILPQLLRVLDLKKGPASQAEVILDLACGAGFFSEVFHQGGAKVIGVDIAPELIAIAKEHASKDIQFLVSPAHQLQKISDQSIDTVVIVLAIQNIKEVKEVFEESKRVLKPQGRLVMILNHPAFRIPGGSSWQWTADGTQYRRIDQYLSEKTIDILMHPGKRPQQKTISFHRPLQYYIKVGQGAGFTLARLEEWISHKKSEPGPRQKEEDRMRKEIPLFMMLEYTSVK
jgi:ubiquinone/menaquinone biosynthesis C-methylase UbiE